MSAVPKSLGVLPPFVLQYDPSNAPVMQVAVSGGGLSGPQLYDYALNNIEPLLEGIPGVASASLNGGRQRQINVVVDPARAQARGVTSTDVASAVAQSNALLAVGRVHLAEVRRQRLHQRRRPAASRTSATPSSSCRTASRSSSGTSPASRTAARRRRRRSRSTARRRLPQRAARARRQHPRDRRRGQEGGRALEEPAAGRGGQGDLRSVDLRAHDLRRPQARDRPGARPDRARDPALPAERPGGAHRRDRDPALVRDHPHRPLRDRADAERLHARRPDAGDGAARRHLGRRPRVDPPPPARRRRPPAAAALEGTNAVACRCSPRRSRRWRCSCRCCCSTGSRRSCSCPLALTVAVGDDRRLPREHAASRPSPAATSCATQTAGRLASGRRARDRPRRRRATRTLLRARAAVSGAPSSARLRRARRRRASGSRRGCRARSFPRSTSRWSASTCALAPGTSLEDAAREDQRDGRDAAPRSCPQGQVELVLTNVGSPEQRAQRHDQPERRPAHGLHPRRARRCRAPHAQPARDRRPDARDPHREATRASSSCSGRAASSPASSRTATSRRSSSRSAATTSRSSTGSRAPSPRSRAPCPASATSTRPLQIDYPEVRVETDRDAGRRSSASPRGRRPDDARGDARQHQHAERLDRRSATASRTTSSPSTTGSVVDDPNALGRGAGAHRRARRGGHARRLRRRSAARSGPSPSSATSCSASRTS